MLKWRKLFLLKREIADLGNIKNLSEKIDILTEGCLYVYKGQADIPLDHLFKASNGDSIDIKNSTIKEGTKLFTGTVPANKNYVTGTVPANKIQQKKAKFQKRFT